MAASTRGALATALTRLATELETAGKATLAPLKARLKPDVAVDALVDAHLMTLRDEAQPGSEAALRKLIADLASGRPDYANMGSDIAAAITRMEPRMQPDLATLGVVKSVTFRGVGIAGGDEFDVAFANGVRV